MAQCKYLEEDLRRRYDLTKENTLIVVSPLRRTLQTYEHGLKWLSDEGVPVELRAEWQASTTAPLSYPVLTAGSLQETTGNPCDIGSDVAEIAKDWPELDFSRLDPVYPAKTGLYDPSEECLRRRALFARQWLYHRPEKYVIVVTHSGFIQRTVVGVKYKNVEYRTYNFDPSDATSGDFTLQVVEVDQDQADIRN